MVGRLRAWWNLTREPLWFWVTLWAMESKPRSFSRATASAPTASSTSGTAVAATRGHDVNQYRKKPVVIEAMQWTGENYGDLLGWVGDDLLRNAEGDLRLYVAANTGWLSLPMGQWVARDRHGFYPIKDDVFRESYDAV